MSSSDCSDFVLANSNHSNILLNHVRIDGEFEIRNSIEHNDCYKRES
jgi:hypothetical protein